MKRRFAILIVLLLLGAIVNIAVACAIQVMAHVHVDQFDGAEYWIRDGDSRFWWKVVSAKHVGLRRVASIWMGPIGGESANSTDQPEPVIPAWAPQMRPSHRLNIERKVLEHLAWEAGWPFLSMGGVVTAGRYDLQRSDEVSYSWCIPIDAGSGDDPILHARLLTFRPLWPGFMLNTLFYALLLWLLFFAPFAARTTLRRRRGLCAKCAYPIGVSPVCTECGAAVAASVARSF